MLGVADLRWLVAATGLSRLGDFFQPIALSVAVIATGGGAQELGVLMATLMTARILCTLYGGVLADRLDPHQMIVAADAARALAIAGLAVAFQIGHPPLVVIAALVAVHGAAGAFFEPAFASLRAIVVPPPLRSDALAVITVVQQAAMVLGPALAGVTIAASNAVVGFAVNAASFAWSAGCVLAIRTRAASRASGGSMLRDIAEGWSAVASRPWLLVGIVSAGVAHLANGAFFVLMELHVVRDLGGPRSLGLISAAMGVGGLLGGALAMRHRPRRYLAAGCLALLAWPLLPLGFGWPGSQLGVMAAAFISQAGLLYFDVFWVTAQQNEIPHELLARVTSWDILVSFVAMPLGNVLAGPLSTVASLPVVMTGIGLWMYVCAAPLLVPQTWRIQGPGPVEAAESHPAH